MSNYATEDQICIIVIQILKKSNQREVKEKGKKKLFQGLSHKLQDNIFQ